MASVSPSVLPLRDIIQFFFPTLVLLVLFSPLIYIFYPCMYRLDMFSIIALAVILGYVVSPPLQRFIIDKLYPNISPALKKIKPIEKWNRRNWVDWGDKLFPVMDSEDKDYLYLLRAYYTFYASIAVYTFFYLLVNIAIILLMTFEVQSLCPLYIKVNPFGFLIAKTPMISPIQEAPSFPLAALSVIIAWFSYASFIEEYTLLYCDQYPKLAEKYHKLKGKIALRLFGQVKTKDGKPVSGAKVTIRDPDTKLILDEVETDADGWYQTKKTINYSIIPYMIEVKKGCSAVTEEQVLDYNLVEEKQIYLKT